LQREGRRFEPGWLHGCRSVALEVAAVKERPKDPASMATTDIAYT